MKNYLVYDCGQVLCAGEGLEELYTQQGGHRVGQHVLDGAGRCGDTEDEHQRETFNVPAVERRTCPWRYRFNISTYKTVAIKDQIFFLSGSLGLTLVQMYGKVDTNHDHFIVIS